MIIDVTNRMELKDMVSSTKKEAAQRNIDITGFISLMESVSDSIREAHPADLRFDVDTGLLVKKGTFKRAFLIAPADLSMPAQLAFDFCEDSTQKTTTYTYTFHVGQVEKNSMSNPGTHMKLYINDDDNKVQVGIIIYLNR